jgi:hypothetical protein
VTPALPALALDVGLAARIRAAHEAARGALHASVRHAVEAGGLLLQAKRTVGHGGWAAWVERNCAMAPRTAQAYMRLAREMPRLDPAKAQRVADSSLRDALSALATDARNLGTLPGPDADLLLEAAPVQGLGSHLKRAVNQHRHAVRLERLQPEPAEPWTRVELCSAPHSPVPARPVHPLVADIIAACRAHKAAEPDLTLEEIIEAVNDAYCILQDLGLGEGASPCPAA